LNGCEVKDATPPILGQMERQRKRLRECHVTFSILSDVFQILASI
jgi:hypothetical protein